MKLFLTLFLFSFINLASDEAAFEQFKVETTNVKMSKALVVDNDFAKKYKKTLLKEFKSGPNFSNSFRLVRMDCGKTCTRIVVINSENGKVYDPSLSVDGSPTWIRGDIIQFKKESKLLIINGCLNEDKTKCGHHEYSWDGESFKLEFFRPIA